MPIRPFVRAKIIFEKETPSKVTLVTEEPLMQARELILGPSGGSLRLMWFKSIGPCSGSTHSLICASNFTTLRLWTHDANETIYTLDVMPNESQFLRNFDRPASPYTTLDVIARVEPWQEQHSFLYQGPEIQRHIGWPVNQYPDEKDYRFTTRSNPPQMPRPRAAYVPGKAGALTFGSQKKRRTRRKRR